MKRRAKIALRILGGISAVLVAYTMLLIVPGPLFAHARAGTFVTVHADEAIPASADSVLRETEALVRRSPIFVPHVQHHIFVCQHLWRWNLLSNIRRNGGALAMAPIGRAVFTRPAHFERNRLVGRSGHETPNERTLSYFFAHEITHTLTADYLGARAFRALPAWVREGYADYVGRGAGFDYEATRKRFLARDPALDPHTSGLYLRYVLLVAHLLDREGWSVERLLHAPPAREAVKASVRR